jgi:hypothetical protein
VYTWGVGGSTLPAVLTQHTQYCSLRVAAVPQPMGFPQDWTPVGGLGLSRRQHSLPALVSADCSIILCVAVWALRPLARLRYGWRRAVSPVQSSVRVPPSVTCTPCPWQAASLASIGECSWLLSWVLWALGPLTRLCCMQHVQDGKQSLWPTN